MPRNKSEKQMAREAEAKAERQAAPRNPTYDIQWVKHDLYWSGNDGNYGRWTVAT